MWEQSTLVLVYSVYQKLVTHYPGLGQLNRKNINRDQLFNAFNRMTVDQLNDPHFDIVTMQKKEKSSNQ